MTKRELQIALDKYKELRREIENVMGVNMVSPMKILVCKGKCSLNSFNLKEYNKFIIK